MGSEQGTVCRQPVGGGRGGGSDSTHFGSRLGAALRRGGCKRRLRSHGLKAAEAVRVGERSRQTVNNAHGGRWGQAATWHGGRAGHQTGRRWRRRLVGRVARRVDPPARLFVPQNLQIRELIGGEASRRRPPSCCCRRAKSSGWRPWAAASSQRRPTSRPASSAKRRR